MSVAPALLANAVSAGSVYESGVAIRVRGVSLHRPVRMGLDPDTRTEDMYALLL